MMFYFETPLAFLLLLFAPFLWKRKHQKNNIPGIPFLIAQGTTLISLPFYIKNRNLILSSLQILAYVCLVTALARPQSGNYLSEEFSEGRDLIIAVDASGSMKALDFKIDKKPVSRLEALKGVVRSFIEERKGDRIGLIVFGEEVFTQCPLTSDHELLLQYLDDLEIGMAGDSTALGDGLALSVKRLKEIPSESKAVILVTDGLKTSGQMEPIQAAEIAKRLGVKVYTIGIGGKAPAPFPVEDIFGRTQITYLDIPVDDETLKQISDLTGGAYFSAQNTEDLLKIYSEIDRLEARKEVTPRLVANKEHFFPFLLAGLFTVLLGELLSRTYLRILS
jgi:Ca-activated chloride channel family protein